MTLQLHPKSVVRSGKGDTSPLSSRPPCLQVFHDNFDLYTESFVVMLRILDILLSAVVLVVLIPLFVVIAIVVKGDSAGPIFYRAKRVGKDGRPFTLYKFRSMVQNADSFGPGITTAGDMRVTPSGAFLRRHKLDELPQFFNVLKGDMSLVGPRPEDPCYVSLYTAKQRRVLRSRPGITSAASLRYRHEESLLSGVDWENVYRTQILPQKLAIDLEYLEHRTMFSDLQLLARTLLSMVQSESRTLGTPASDLGQSR